MATKNYQLNKTQIEILKLLYTFRYVTPPLLTQLREVHITTTRVSLESLYEKKLLHKRYDKSYKLLGKPASYSLSPEGVRAVGVFLDTNKKYVHSMYKNARASDAFIEQSLDILAAYVSLSKTYPGVFTIFTRAETIDFEASFPTTLPNLYLSKNKPSLSQPNHYLLDIYTNVQKSVLYKKIDMYIDHFESGDWSEDEHPAVLLVLDNSYVESVVQKIIEERRDSRYIEDQDLNMLTTTKKALLTSTTKAIWSDPVEPEKLLSL